MLFDLGLRLSSAAWGAARALVRPLSTSPARGTARLLLAGGAATLAVSGITTCTSDQERAFAIWRQVGGSEARYGDLHSVGLGEVLGVAAHSSGKLVSDPPDIVEI